MFRLKVQPGHEASHSAAVGGNKKAVGYDDLGLLFKGENEGVPRELPSIFLVSRDGHFVY